MPSLIEFPFRTPPSTSSASNTGFAKTTNLAQQMDVTEADIETMRGRQTFCSGWTRNLPLRLPDLLPENMFGGGAIAHSVRHTQTHKPGKCHCKFSLFASLSVSSIIWIEPELVRAQAREVSDAEFTKHNSNVSSVLRGGMTR